jgi:hypothetical protein
MQRLQADDNSQYRSSDTSRKSGWLDEKTCYHDPVENRTEPKTARQWLRYIVVAIIALGLVAWMLRLYVL